MSAMASGEQPRDLVGTPPLEAHRSPRAWVERALASRHVPVLAAALATALAIPALTAGEALDDYFHRALLRPEGAVALSESEHGIFGFLDDDSARTHALTELGVFPWWTGDDTRAAFFRPLAELTHRADYLLWPENVPAMHAHSLAWGALLVLAVAAFYRRFLGAGWMAGLATLLYAIDDAHALPIAWLANRNAILATLFGVLALLAHDRWRRAGRARWAPVAVALLAASVLSAEAGIATMAYLAAHALFLDPARGWRKLVPLAPHATVILAWRTGACVLGYGAHGSGLYIDPLHDPARFAAALVQRAPVLLMGQWSPVPSDVDGALFASARPYEALLALAGLALLAWVIVPRLRDDGVSRFLATGMLLAVVPIAATFPSDRLLFFVGIGAMGLCARAIGSLLRDRKRAARRVGAALAVTHLAIAPLAFPVRAQTPSVISDYLDPCTQAPVDEAIAGQHLVILNALDSCTAYLPVRAPLDGRPTPRSARTLTSGVVPITLTREGERSLLVEREEGWFTTTFEMVFWDPDRRWTIGEHRRLEGMDVEIRGVTADGRPRAVRFTFDVPLEDPSLRWMQVDRDGALVPAPLPRPGEGPTTLTPVYP